MPPQPTVLTAAVAEVTQRSLLQAAPGAAPADPRAVLTEYVRTKKMNDTVVPAVAALVGDIGQQVRDSGTLAQVPAAAVGNVRNDMYLTSEALRAFSKGGVKFEPETQKNVAAFKSEIDNATKPISGESSSA